MKQPRQNDSPLIGEPDVLEWLEGTTVIGVDEAGRGPVAGSMFIGAVAFSGEDAHTIGELGLRDSKKIAEKKRFRLEDSIVKLARCAVGVVTLEEINSGRNLNTLWSEAAANIVSGLIDNNDDVVVFVDGNIKIAGIDPDIQITRPKFDSTSWSVAAASILAKNAQVRNMLVLDEKYPEYHFSSHKGYLTNKHQDAIEKYGVCDAHRKYWIKI